jgi:polyisoprenoid-binding protein YceI
VRYAIDSERSQITALATSNVHDTTCRLSRVSGWVEADSENLLRARAHIDVDMRVVDAGDFLKNAKLKKDLDLDRYPQASFDIDKSESTSRDGGTLMAVVRGTLRWRNREKVIQAKARGTLSPERLEATAEFSFDMRDFDLEPPRVLMFKIEPLIAVKVRLLAAR